MAAKRKRVQSFPRRRAQRKAHFLLNPDHWGMALGAAAATLVLLVDYYRDPSTPLGFPVLIGAGLAFVVSYLAAALFVWYLRQVKESELDTVTTPHLDLSGPATAANTESAQAAGPSPGEGQSPR